MNVFKWIIVLILVSILIWLIYDIPVKENFTEMYPPNTLFVEGGYPYYYWYSGQGIWNNASPTTKYDSYDIRDYSGLFV